MITKLTPMLGIIRPRSAIEWKWFSDRYGSDAALFRFAGGPRLPSYIEPPPGRSRSSSAASVASRIDAARNTLRCNRRNAATNMERETAYHEAGHAVIATLHGIEVISATVRNRGDVSGTVWVSKAQLRVSNRDRRICFTIAGAIAGCIGMGKPVSEATFHGSDEECLVRDTGTGWYRDIPFFKARVRETELQLRQNWCAVERIALMLLGDVDLDGAEITRVVAECKPRGDG